MFSYLANFLSIVLVSAYLLTNIKGIDGKLTFPIFLIILFTLGILGLTAAVRAEIYTVLLYLKILVFIVFFRMAEISVTDFSKFINYTYLVYCFLSVLFFFDLMPFKLYTKWDHPTMYADFGVIRYYVFYGLEGGTSSIDSYSGFVLLWNIFVNKSPNRKYFIALSVFFVLYTLRMTPLAGLLASILAYYIVKGPKSAMIFILTGNVLFVYVNYCLYNDIDPLGVDIPFKEIMYAATHGRSMIWEQQLAIMFKEYSLTNYILGGYDTSLFSIPALQVWGGETGDYYDNPHNTYLLLFFRSPLLFCIYYPVLLYLLFKKFDRKEFVVLIFILVVFYTNSSIISLQNPLYMMAMIYLLLNDKRRSIA